MIAEAEATGECIAELSSPREAELFRYAVNNNRRLKKIGPDLTTKIEGNRVTVFRRPTIVQVPITETD